MQPFHVCNSEHGLADSSGETERGKGREGREREGKEKEGKKSQSQSRQSRDLTEQVSKAVS